MLAYKLIFKIKEKEQIVMDSNRKYRGKVFCVRYVLFVLFCIVLVQAAAWGSATGLNNIPTTDVVPENVLVFQYWNNFGNDDVSDNFMGFKYGLMKNVEIGLDGQIFPEKAKNETLVMQGKIRFDLDDQLAVAFGITDLGDRAKAGKEFPYGVLTYDFGFLRTHFGGTTKDDNEGFFGGLDKTFQFLDRDFMFRADILEVNDQNDTLSSVGFIYDLGSNFLIESWVSFPSETGKDDYYTVKLNYVIKF